MHAFSKARIIIPTAGYSCSLVGIRDDRRPLAFGNYVEFHVPSRESPARCVNFWRENLEEVQKNYLHDGMVAGWLYAVRERYFFLVDDARIPAEWYFDEIDLPPGAVADDMRRTRG